MSKLRTLLSVALPVVILTVLLSAGLAAAKDFTIGLILVGPYNDKGYSQAQFDGGKYVEAKMPGAKMIYLDKVNPADRPGLTIPQVVDDLIEKGADLIIAGSDDMKDGILEAAAMHPDKTFVHVSGDATWGGNGPANLGNLFGRMEYPKMMAGFTAAMTTQTGKIGFLGPLINEETRRLVASAYLGAAHAWTTVRGKDIKDLSFNVKWIGFWFNIPGVTADPTQVAGSFYDSGCDVIISGIDTPEAVTVARQKSGQGKNVFAIPYDYEKACEGQGAICLGVPYFNWGPGFLRIAKQVQDGTYKPAFEWEAPHWANINDHDKSPVGFMPGEGMTAQTQAKLDEFVARMGSGQLDLFTGPLNYQDGSVFLKPGEKATDKQIWYMEQLLEGMTGLSSAK
ncbi:MAG: BMP family ABC transporter substrate-binding protein [Pseudodesulfovibrio sp.]|uniref:Basic membrane lipoprotein n=1 Tax=Pseudodesulfovibrio aespoeensis (strain ATCC 700646 / DSM 10631 / Aspo-2) TaxID=643562 RepID=E6VWR8_PSEA9|nr:MULTISPECIES: BMP family ABC transporter substrate-binding protein [Pseudodesulfovibrio]MBU4192438.1 BMP family ABC transporter substrate-binding protein [Pseudomonadota bacterium]ADU63680.1 basic membrane lipoprotein [Pseudodesulfovibrio aespoeensis Aspo-2]MBU4244963.1 BMP family ABC transporter substrate-binding protein [Pseudomonadota bacterium]MBU4378047.1 BMP family ABC transporter substrate-binding protein [Pseudomonadota bacterium]MBU4476334.1 BMP family ABC transporter substrate-bin